MTADAMRKGTIYTIGHSTHGIKNFVALLKRHRINAVADVRSVPHSRWQPQFNREDLAEALKAHGIAYVFLGKELGARSDDAECYEKARVKYRLLAKTPLFRSGIKRIRDGSCHKSIALMCAEKDPLECHRTILVARELVEAGTDVAHILENGHVEPHSVAMKRLFEQLGLLPEQKELFRTVEDLRDQAYAAQEQRIAYVDKERAREVQEAQ